MKDEFPLSFSFAFSTIPGDFVVMAKEIENALAEHQGAFKVELSHASIERLAAYYELVMEHNPLLHLVGPCSAEEFAVRHILESLTLLEHLPERARFADVGTGAGLPGIPCLLVRNDLRATLIESKEKKAAYLADAVSRLCLDKQGAVVGRQFAEVDPGDIEFVTSRALDKFIDRLPQLARWSGRRMLLLFGGESMAEALSGLQLRFVKKLIPMSERRYLFVVER